jgi:UPF0271 protein
MAPRRAIDLNADVGEHDTPGALMIEQQLVPHVTSVNIACGGHAGDRVSMARSCQLALRHELAIGAHPAYPDRPGFGRRAFTIDTAALRDALTEQLAAFRAICADMNAAIRHVKPHGRLYHDADASPEIAGAIADAARTLDDHILLVGRAGGAAIERWRAAGLRVAAEAFADRRYGPDGRLVPRDAADAVIHDPDAAADQALAITQGRPAPNAPAPAGPSAAIHADTLCIHADTPNSPTIAETVRRRLEAGGIRVTAGASSI